MPVFGNTQGEPGTGFFSYTARLITWEEKETLIDQCT